MLRPLPEISSLAEFLISGPFAFISSKPSLCFLSALVLAIAVSPAGPLNKVGHPALRHERSYCRSHCWVSLLGAGGIETGSKVCEIVSFTVNRT